MAFYLSPGVYVKEYDLTTIVPAVGTSQAAFAGRFAWGPANTIVTLSNENQLVATFGKPDANTYESFFSAANFLAYSDTLRVVRAANSAVARNATDGNAGLYIANRDQYEESYRELQAANNFGIFAARYPGELGNSLRVEVRANNNGTWAYDDQFDRKPGTSAYANSIVAFANDEMNIVVIDTTGAITESRVANTVIEKFAYVSKASDAKNEDGTSNYYVNVINERSRWVYVINHPEGANNWGQTVVAANVITGTGFTQNANTYIATLANGVSGVVSDGTLKQAYDKFKNAEEVDVSLIITGSASPTVVQHVIDNIALDRKDCVAFYSPARANVVGNIGAEASKSVDYRNLVGRSTSYAVMDCNWKYQYDKYNDVYRWVPLNADIAGLCARTDNIRDPWYSPAGLNRGQIKNVVKLAWNPNKTERDTLYVNNINPVVTFPGEGTVLYGDKTTQNAPSAFDRINVRRLFIVLEKAIARAAKYSLFEFNDEFTRAQFVALVEPFLRDVQGRRGIYDFRVVCDTTNNTPEVIDRNEFVGDIYIKPARSINFIILNFVAVRTGVAFEEVVGKF